MTRFRTTAVVAICLACALVLVATGTGGLSVAQVDRGFQAAVVEDSSAYVGFSQECEDGELTITVTNRFDDRLTDGVVAVDEQAKRLAPFPVEPGETRRVTFEEVDPGDPIVVEVAGDDVSTTLYRSVPADCENGPDDVRPAISFVAVCGVEDATVEATAFKDGGEPVGANWSTDGDPTAVVYKTGSGPPEGTGSGKGGESDFAIYGVAPANASGSFVVGDGTPVDREPNDPCGDESGVKFEWTGEVFEEGSDDDGK